MKMTFWWKTTEASKLFGGVSWSEMAECDTVLVFSPVEKTRVIAFNVSKIPWIDYG